MCEFLLNLDLFYTWVRHIMAIFWQYPYLLMEHFSEMKRNPAAGQMPQSSICKSK
jgi:hypothetical protein